MSQRLAGPLDIFGQVFRNDDLRRMELAWATSNLGSRASAIAVAVYAYETDGTAAVGIIAFARLAAAAATSPWLGVLADRWPRRQVMVGADVARCLMVGPMAVLALLDAAPLAVYALAVLIAIAEPPFRSAQAALTPSLVRTPAELTAANVIASGVESVGLFAGPALGALLLAFSSTGAVFAVSGALLVCSVILAARISVVGIPSREPSVGRSQTLLAGARVIGSEPGLRIVIGLFAVQTFVAGMLNVLVVVLALQLLDLGTAGVGWLDGIVGIGAALGILVVAGVAGRNRLAGYFAIGLLLWGAPLVLIAAWPETAPVLVLLALVGIGNTLVDVTGITLMQRAAPDAVLGRVFGVFEALVLLTMALGSLLTPLLVSALGIRGAVLVAGLILPAVLLPLWRPLVAIDNAARAPSREVELLRQVPIFAPLPVPELERLARALTEEHVESGTVVFAEGAHGERFYVIAGGHAVVEADGRPVRGLKAGDSFGEIALLRNVPRTATVRAITPLRLYTLDRDMFVATVAGDPASAAAAGSIVAARLPAPVIG